MSNGGDSKSGRKRMRDRIPNFGRHLLTPNFGRRSRSPSPTPSSTSGRKKSSAAAIAPSSQVRPSTSARPAAGLSTPGHTFASSTAASPTNTGHATSPDTEKSAEMPPTLDKAPPTPPTTLPHTLSPLEIRQRTADLLKDRLTPEEAEKINWDDTTPEQAKAVVEEVQKSLEGKPEHTGKMYKTLQYINKYATIIDVAIQHQPCITALVWAGMRTVIQLAWNRYETYDSLEQATQAITTTITNCAFYHGLYRSFAQSPKSTTLGYNKEMFGALESQLPQLYAAVIELSVKAKNYWNPPSIADSLKQPFQPFSIEFKPLLDEIMEREKALRELASGAAMVEILENSGRLRELDECSRELKKAMEATLGDIRCIYDKLCKTISEQDVETFINCRKWLGALEAADSEYNKNRNRLLEGTCRWILETKEFQLLMNAGEQKHLWAHGKPGAGKSVLASFVITEMRKHAATDLQVLYFFCKDDGHQTSNASAIAIVSNLIDQLIERNRLESLLEILKEARKKHAKSEKCTSFGVLWDIFVAMTQGFPTPIIVVVDALDECLIERKAFLEALISFPHDRVRFFLTSRNELDIDNTLGQDPRVVKRPMDVEADIERFVLQRVEQLPRLHNFKTQVIQAVLKHSAGMFRYAELFLDELDSPGAMLDIPVMLQRPPVDLNEMYDNILLRLESTDTGRRRQRNQEARRKVLTWVGMASRPLWVDELAYACAVGDGEEKIDPTQRLLHSEQDLLGICGPLVEIVGGIVQYTHLSVREYLFRSGSHNYCIQEESAHASIAITSLALLRSSNMPHRYQPFKDYQYRFYYFVEFWLYHASNVAADARETNTPSELSEAILKFFSDYNAFKSWATTVSDKYILDQYIVPKPYPLHIAAGYGLQATAGLLVNGGANVLVTDSSGRTPVHYACSRGYEGLARLLVDKGADISAADNEGKTPLYWASVEGHSGVVQLLIDGGAGVSAADNEGKTPLYWASYWGHSGMAQLLMDKGADISAADSDGTTPLLRASYGGHLGVVQLLIDGGAGVSAADNEGKTPLYWASYWGHSGMAQLLMDKGADVSAVDNKGMTPLYWASCRGHSGVVRLLIDKGADVSAADNEGKTPLYRASMEGHSEVVQLLIDKGADVSAADIEGMTPLYWASYRGHSGVVRLLIDKGADVSAADNEGKTPLYRASMEGHSEVVQLLIGKGADVSAADIEGMTPLYWASCRGHSGVVRLLIDKGADVSAADNEGETPLYRASMEGHSGVVQLLIDKGADVSAADNEGMTPLYWASCRGHSGVVRLLIDKGADVSAADNEGKTPLYMASIEGHSEVVQLLIDKGADVSAADNEGMTPLHWASHMGHSGVVQLLIDEGADVSAADNEGKTLLYWASYWGHSGMAQLLMDKGADVSAADNKGKTPLYWASSKGHSEVVRLLIDGGAGISAANGRGKTPLLKATYWGHDGVARLLIDRGADVSAADDEGKTPLYWASRKGHSGVVQLLIDKGADVSAADSDGITPT